MDSMQRSLYKAPRRRPYLMRVQFLLQRDMRVCIGYCIPTSSLVSGLSEGIGSTKNHVHNSAGEVPLARDIFPGVRQRGMDGQLSFLTLRPLIKALAFHSISTGDMS